MLCPCCGKDMYDNREGKKNPKAPDYRCKDKECKYEFDKVSNEWVQGEYTTAIWLPKGTPKEAVFTAKPKEPKKSLLKAFDDVVKPEEKKKEKELVEETEQDMWDGKEKRGHKRAFMAILSGCFAPVTNETPEADMGINRWTKLRDLADVMMNDLQTK